MTKSLAIYANKELALFLESMFVKYFHHVYLNPNYNELIDLEDVSVILDLVNYDTSDETILINHNTSGVKKILDAAKKLNAKYFFVYHLNDHTNQGISIVRNFVKKYSIASGIDSSFVGMPDIYGPTICTNHKLNLILLNLANNKSVDIISHKKHLIVYEDSVYEGLLNFIITKINFTNEFLFYIKPSKAYTEEEIAEEIIKTLDNKNYFNYNYSKEPALEIEYFNSYWQDNTSLKEGINIMLLAYDIPKIIKSTTLPDLIELPKITEDIEIKSNVNSDNTSAPESKFGGNTVSELEEEIQSNKLNIYDKYSVNKSKRKHLLSKKRIKYFITAVLIISCFSLISSFNFIFKLAVGSYYSKVASENLKNHNYSLAYDMSETALAYLNDKNDPLIINYLAKNLLNTNLSAQDVLNILENNIELTNNIAYVNKSLAQRLSFKADAKVLGASTKDTIQAAVERSLDLINLNSEYLKSLDSNSGFYKKTLKPMLQLTSSEKTKLENLNAISNHIEGFLGIPDEKTYIILLLDKNNITPSGGSIKYYGNIKSKNGKLDFSFLKSSGDLDKLIDQIDEKACDKKQKLNSKTRSEFASDKTTELIECQKKIIPPLSLRMATGADRLKFSNSNLDADFNNSAVIISGIYKIYENNNTDGVITINKDAFVELLSQTKIDISNIDKRYEDLNEAKNLLVNLINYINEKKDPLIGDKLLSVLNRKDIIVHVNDSQTLYGLSKNNWSGSVYSDDREFIQILDTNIKSDGQSNKITRGTKFMANLENKLLKRELTINYSTQDIAKDYLNHVKVVLPKDILVKDVVLEDNVKSSIKRSSEIYPKSNKINIDFDINLRANTSVSVKIYYESETSQKTLKLDVYKQPGITNEKFILETNKKYVDKYDILPAKTEGGNIYIETTLDTNNTFDIYLD